MGIDTGGIRSDADTLAEGEEAARLTKGVDSTVDPTATAKISGEGGVCPRKAGEVVGENMPLMGALPITLPSEPGKLLSTDFLPLISSPELSDGRSFRKRFTGRRIDKPCSR